MEIILVLAIVGLLLSAGFFVEELTSEDGVEIVFAIPYLVYTILFLAIIIGVCLEIFSCSI